MIAIDTNILARYLLNDEFEQSRAAARLLGGRELIDVPLSVWLELVWVLEVNGCSKPEIIKGLRHIIGLPSIRPRTLGVFLFALRWYEEGMDFGDSLHLAMSAGNERFVSFDKAVTRMAAKI